MVGFSPLVPCAPQKQGFPRWDCLLGSGEAPAAVRRCLGHSLSQASEHPLATGWNQNVCCGIHCKKSQSVGFPNVGVRNHPNIWFAHMGGSLQDLTLCPCAALHCAEAGKEPLSQTKLLASPRGHRKCGGGKSGWSLHVHPETLRSMTNQQIAQVNTPPNPKGPSELNKEKKTWAWLGFCSSKTRFQETRVCHLNFVADRSLLVHSLPLSGGHPPEVAAMRSAPNLDGFDKLNQPKKTLKLNNRQLSPRGGCLLREQTPRQTGGFLGFRIHAGCWAPGANSPAKSSKKLSVRQYLLSF